MIRLLKSIRKNAISITGKYRMIIAMTVFLGFVLSGYDQVNATTVNTGSKVSVTVNYEDETATVKPGSGKSTKLYISKDNKKTWDIIEPLSNGGDGTQIGTVDISSFFKTKETYLYFKGNKDINPTELALKPLEDNLDVYYKIVGEKGMIMWTPSQQIEYRIGNNANWKKTGSSIPTAAYEIYGATFYIRTPATGTKHSGKIYTVKVPRKPNAPSIKVDGSKLCISGLKPGESQYRIGDNTAWTDFNPTDTKIKYKNLKDLYDKVPGDNTALSPITIEFRTKASDKKIASAVKLVEVPQQPVTSEGAVRLDGTTLSIDDTNKKRAYEYVIIHSGETLDLQKARWSSVSVGKPLLLKKAVKGDSILVRMKSTTEPSTKQIIPAATYVKRQVDSITLPVKK